MASYTTWSPPDFQNVDIGPLGEITQLFFKLYPKENDGALAEKIGRYWVDKLKDTWKKKPAAVKKKDMAFNPDLPLSRVMQKTVLITYADSIYRAGDPTFKTLRKFLQTFFPAVSGIHVLPPCKISTERFNDGGFSQISRCEIHKPYGTNTDFEEIMADYFSMTDFVLNHVDMAHKKFQAYLNGCEESGRCFFIFSETEYEKRKKRGDFDHIFRPRPFPLFTIFRKIPGGSYRTLSQFERIQALNTRFAEEGLSLMPEPVINILCLFNKISNDQMLLNEDYAHVKNFIAFLESTGKSSADNFFTVSRTQETENTPYIFEQEIDCPETFLKKVLPLADIPAKNAPRYAEIYQRYNAQIFGESVRVLTTFSHVQVDLNLSTFEGLKLLIDDFSWYLQMDLNMLRLDAANFAFKKWGTSCFGLPETGQLLKALYLSMESVAPRMVPNLEVNAPLSTVLGQMADKSAPPPMMYDFHLASMMPVVFMNKDARPLLNISQMIKAYNIPHESIRFSLDESHDGKSVNGSGGADDLLTYEEREKLVQLVRRNKGYVKYKNAPKGVYPVAEFKKICRESGLIFSQAASALFKENTSAANILYLKDTIKNDENIATALQLSLDELKKSSALSFFTEKILKGREPYELCITTRDILPEIEDRNLEIKRFIAFKTLSFALMGRHVKSVYINDLMGLPNDHDLVKETGELRNIKRTRSNFEKIEQLLNDKSSPEYLIAKEMNRMIAFFDKDPAFDPRGEEAHVFVPAEAPHIAITRNRYQDNLTAVIINTSMKKTSLELDMESIGLDRSGDLFDCLHSEKLAKAPLNDKVKITIGPFDRLFLKTKR